MRAQSGRVRNSWRWIAAGWVVAGVVFVVGLEAQPPTFQIPEAPGVTVAGDFDGDGCDDVLILGVTGLNRTYLGMRQKPYLRRGPAWPFFGMWALADAPQFVGGHLYVPTKQLPGVFDVRVFALRGKAWQLRRVVPLSPSSPIYPVTSARVTAFHRDIDQDGKPDAFVAWSESPVTSWGGFHAATLSPSGMGKRTLLKPFPGQHLHSVVVDVHRSRSLIRPKDPEYLVVMSAPTDQPTGGFGFRIVRDGPQPGAGLWATNGPPIAYGKSLHIDSGMVYGDSRILPTAGASLLQVATGESVLLQPWVQAPYVGKIGESLPTRKLGRWLDQCTADYDGDGRDESVFVDDPRSTGFQTDVLVGDPSHRRAWSQHFYLEPAGRTNSVFHGSAGDFDGDGDPDLLLALVHDNLPRNGFLALFRADRSRRPGKPVLRREY